MVEIGRVKSMQIKLADPLFSLFLFLLLSTIMMAGCSGIMLEELYEDTDKNTVAFEKTLEREPMIFSEEEKISLERISNEYGKCAAYYKYAVLMATTTDITPFENTNEVSEKQAFFTINAIGVAIQFAGAKKGRVLAIENHVKEYRNNMSIQEPTEIETLISKRKSVCSPALSNPENLARANLSSSESDAKLKLKLNEIFKRIEAGIE